MMTPFTFTQRNNGRMNQSVTVTLPGWVAPFDDVTWHSQVRQPTSRGNILLLDFWKTTPGQAQPPHTLELGVEATAAEAGTGHPRVIVTFAAPVESLAGYEGAAEVDIVAIRDGRRDVVSVGAITFEPGVTQHYPV